MKWIGERISFVDSKQKTTVVIYPHASAWVKGIMGAWVSMWLVIGCTVIWSFFNLKLTDKENIILIVFMTFWSYYAVRVTRSFFWLLWGKELLKLDEVALHYKRSVRGFGRSIPYYYENIAKLRVDQPEQKSIQAVWEASPWIRGGERLSFEFRGVPIRFGMKLPEKDAKLLFQFLSRKVEEGMRKSKF
jgi:hypothetical protein